MKGHDFESFIKAVYELLGYNVEQTKKSGDQGIDLIIKKHFKKIGVQLKRYSGTVGNSAVQEAVAGKRFYKLDRVCVLTNRFFTRSAIELAKANKVELLDRNDLLKMIKKAKKKYRRKL
ncbi:MAG: restriction endonuclease [Clostridia bacterium]|nr:restriction endonuclease [Clostridia bacterium]